MNNPFDVIVLGYGPVGALLANLLGRDGLSIAVVERAHDIYDKPRAISIDHEVMRLLQSVDLADAVAAITSHHTGTEFRGVDGRLIKAFRPLSPPYPLGWPPNLMFIQPEFEPILRTGAERFGTTVLLGHEAIDVAQTADEVRVSLRAPGGNTREMRARYLVACDGAASPTRKRLGISQESLDFDEWWTVVDAWLKEGGEVPASTTQFCRPSGPTTYVVGPRTLRRWELKLLPHENPATYEDPEALRRRMRPFVDPDHIDIWRVATYRFHALVADAWRRGRILLAGDAAHQTPPFMAQGLCAGIRDAGNLAWKLTALLRNGAPDALLDTYEAERKPHIRALVATTKALGLIIGELDPERARQRDETLGATFDAGNAETLRQKFIPDLAAGLLAIASDGHPVFPAGVLSPQPEVIDVDGRRVLLDDVIGPRFSLLTTTANAQTWLDATSDAIWARIDGARLTIGGDGDVTETGTLFRDFMDNAGCEALIVRPDKYVFGGASDAETLNRQIRRIGTALGAT